MARIRTAALLAAAVTATLALAACNRDASTTAAPATPTAPSTQPALATTPTPDTTAQSDAASAERAADPVGALAGGTDSGVPGTDTPRPDHAGTLAASGTGGIAQLEATEGHTANGRLLIAADIDGVRVTGTLVGLTPNAEHGFHVHEKGDCSAPDAMSAGGHFNPTNQPHGDPAGAAHHGGDIPNLKADAQGNAIVDARVPGLTLGDGSATDAMGKAIVVHEKRDDYTTQPSGDSGARIACGVISRA